MFEGFPPETVRKLLLYVQDAHPLTLCTCDILIGDNMLLKITLKKREANLIIPQVFIQALQRPTI